VLFQFDAYLIFDDVYQKIHSIWISVASLYVNQKINLCYY